jgi:predicted PurR-regulated permease PerM
LAAELPFPPDGRIPEDSRSSEESTPEPVPFPVNVNVHSVALTGLLLLAVLYTLHFARALILPLVLVMLLDALFSPLVRRLKRARVPEALSAALILATLVGTIGVGAYRLSGPAAAWVASAPQSLAKARSKLKALRLPLENFNQTAAQVEEITDMGSDEVVQVEVKQTSLGESLFGGTREVLTGAVLVSVLLFFTLSAGDLFLVKAIKALPRLQDKKRAVQIARDTEDQISSYLTTVTLINAAFGFMVGVAMYWLGMPNPVLWGVLAGVTNFIPYVGALLCMSVLAMVALVHFDTLGPALAVVVAFFVLNLIESYLLTPLVVGRQLSLNPVAVFVGVLFWGWIWGVVGALLAVPILAMTKIFCDRIEGLAPLGEFLGQ